MLSPLRRERILREMSLYDVRTKTGIAVSKLSLVERGIERPREDEKRSLAQALGIPMEDIFPFTGEKNS